MSEQAALESQAAPGRFSLKRLYHWVLHWADTPYGLPALFLIAFAESSFFPIPPDVLLVALVLGKPKGWIKTAAVCTAGSVLGGMAGYAIGMLAWSAVQDAFLTYVFKPEVFDIVVAKYEENALLTVFSAAFSPIPYKVITIAAGVCQISFASLVLGSVVGRGLRFFTVAGLLSRFGDPMKAFIDKYFNILTILFTILLIGGFVLVKYLL